MISKLSLIDREEITFFSGALKEKNPVVSLPHLQNYQGNDLWPTSVSALCLRLVSNSLPVLRAQRPQECCSLWLGASLLSQACCPVSADVPHNLFPHFLLFVQRPGASSPIYPDGIASCLSVIPQWTVGSVDQMCLVSRLQHLARCPRDLLPVSLEMKDQKKKKKKKIRWQNVN